MSDERQLNDSRAWCARLCRQSKSSFYYSFSLLDRPRRQAMCALYAFARITDDIADSSQPVNVRTAELFRWSAVLHARCNPARSAEKVAVIQQANRQLASLQTASSQFASLQDNGTRDELRAEQLWPALEECLTRYDIPISLLDDLIRGVAMDLDPKPFENWDSVDDYCYHVASAVGLACTHIWKASHEVPHDNAINCGIAFQLTNILRDVAEDARTGRIYLPDSELERFGVDRARWLAGDPDGRWPELIDAIASRSRELYAFGWQTIESLTPRSQRMFSLMWRSYRALLEQVVGNKHRLWDSHRKIKLPRRKKFHLLTTHWLPTMSTRLPG